MRTAGASRPRPPRGRNVRDLRARAGRGQNRRHGGEAAHRDAGPRADAHRPREALEGDRPRRPDQPDGLRHARIHAGLRLSAAEGRDAHARGPPQRALDPLDRRARAGRGLRDEAPLGAPADDARAGGGVMSRRRPRVERRKDGAIVLRDLPPALALALHELRNLLRPDGEGRPTRLADSAYPDDAEGDEHWKKHATPVLLHLFESARATVLRDLDGLQSEFPFGARQKLAIPEKHLAAWLSTLAGVRVALGD